MSSAAAGVEPCLNPQHKLTPKMSGSSYQKNPGARVARNIALIDERPFVRDCLARTFNQCSEFNVIPFLLHRGMD